MKKETQKQMKGNRGITLVALVVTIVVLLILAGITISTLFGDNGIISAARKAAEDTERVEGDTQNQLGNLANEMNEQLPGGTTGIKASQIAAEPSKYYGQKVNYTAGSTSFQSDLGVDWKIFYADSDHIYLIASDYILNDKLPASTNASGTVTTNKPSATTYYKTSMDFTPIVNDYLTGSARVPDNVRYLNKKYFDYLSTDTYYSTNPVTNNNMKVVAYMLDTKAWEGFKDANGKADFVIGGPTVEMLFNSYCQKNNLVNSSGANQYQARVQSTMGYQISSDYGTNWSTDISLSDLSINDPEQLYVISSISNGWIYWLASPSAYAYDTDRVMYVFYSGGVCSSNFGYNKDYCSIRPIVALKSNVSLVEQADESFNIK